MGHGEPVADGRVVRRTEGTTGQVCACRCGSAPAGAGRRNGDGSGDAWMGRVRSWNGRVRRACECTDKHGEVGNFFICILMFQREFALFDPKRPDVRIGSPDASKLRY